jgi:gas vesicle protein
MAKDKGNKSGKVGGFIKGSLIGAAIGTVAALLLAPKSGKETQADIKNKAKSVIKDADQKLAAMEGELEGRIDNLRLAAKELRGEAFEESQRLITRAEILKRDLQDSALHLTQAGREAGKDAMVDAKRLVNEGTAVMDELERMTKHVVASAKTKAKQQVERDAKNQKK